MEGEESPLPHDLTVAFSHVNSLCECFDLALLLRIYCVLWVLVVLVFFSCIIPE